MITIDPALFASMIAQHTSITTTQVFDLLGIHQRARNRRAEMTVGLMLSTSGFRRRQVRGGGGRREWRYTRPATEVGDAAEVGDTATGSDVTKREELPRLRSRYSLRQQVTVTVAAISGNAMGAELLARDVEQAGGVDVTPEDLASLSESLQSLRALISALAPKTTIDTPEPEPEPEPEPAIDDNDLLGLDPLATACTTRERRAS